ncbi:MAG: N-acetylmuramoyl-L-alanine amidase [Inquilinus sp.]|nr:N-acetylmuramoyl-L-alanine amidase [Inquilinus sp.]
MRVASLVFATALAWCGLAPLAGVDDAWAQDTASAVVPTLSPPGAASAASGVRPAVLSVRIGDHGSKTRFVLEMTAAADFRIFALENPHRMVVDFAAGDWRATSARQPVGLITGHRYGRQQGGALRVVLDLAGPADIVDSFYLPAAGATPYRFVLDLVPTTPPGSTGRSGSASVAPAALSVPLPPRRPAPAVERRIVAIDPGHGGIDPGAIGASGLREKELTLDIARRVKARLEATGRYTVVLTREGDEFLRLPERVRRARASGADLLLSLHADSIGNPTFRGASVYTLSDVASDRQAEMLAQRENRADALAGIALDPVDDVTASILIDLAQRHTQNESNGVAQKVVEALADATPLIGTPHRYAGFAVLKAPDVPSVLVELGYLSNRREETQLRSAAHRAGLAAALAEAIDAYFDWRDPQRRS